MCLDVMRALSREPDSAAALLADLAQGAAGDPALATEAKDLMLWLSAPGRIGEADGRVLAQRLVLLAQACLLRRNAAQAVADAFIATRFADQRWGHVVGGLDTRAIDMPALLQRAYPA
jgi:putative acyl-CoA dehydrogenase